MTWTTERVAFLTAKWKEGWSAGELASHLGVTRNAAIGKLSRLGLVGFKPKKSSPKPRKPVAEPVAVKAPTIGGISLYDLTSTTCRWPIGSFDIRYCGANCDVEKPYCTDHTQLATRR